MTFTSCFVTYRAEMKWTDGHASLELIKGRLAVLYTSGPEWDSSYEATR
jgi:hypothetical protein